MEQYFSLLLSRILVALFSSLSKKIYLHGSRDVKFYIATYQKKSMIRQNIIFEPGISMPYSENFQSIE